MDGKKRGRRSGSSRASEAAPKMRKSCNACASAKRKCDGASCCSLCMKRGSRCIYSERQKSGPKGAKGDEAGAGDAQSSTVSVSRSHEQRNRASPVSSVVAPITKRGRKATIGTGILPIGSSYDDCHPPISSEMMEVPPGVMEEIARTAPPLVAASTEKAPERGRASSQARQDSSERTVRGAASEKSLLPPAITRQQFTRATPATPSPPRQLPSSVLQGSPGCFALPGTAVEVAPSTKASSEGTEVLPWTAIRVPPGSTGSISHLPWVPSSSEENFISNEVHLRIAQDARDFEERNLSHDFELPDGTMESRCFTTDGVSKLLDCTGDYVDGGNTSNSTRRAANCVQRVRDDVERGQLQCVVVDPQQLASATGGESRGSLLPSPRVVRRVQAQEQIQRHWVSYQPRSLSPSVVSSIEPSSIRNGGLMMEISPHRSGCDAGRLATSNDGVLLENPQLDKSACPSGVVEGMVVVTPDESVARDTVSGTPFSGKISSDAGNGDEVFSGISAEAAVATLVEVMGGQGNTNQLLTFDDEMHQRRQQHHLRVQLPPGTSRDGCAKAGSCTSRSEQISWYPHLSGLSHMHGTVAFAGRDAFPGDATVCMPVMIPTVPRQGHPVPEDQKLQSQQRLHEMQPLGMFENVPTLSKGVRLRGASDRYLGAF